MGIAESGELIETNVPGDKDREYSCLKAGLLLLSEIIVCAWAMESLAMQLSISGD